MPPQSVIEPPTGSQQGEDHRHPNTKDSANPHRDRTSSDESSPSVLDFPPSHPCPIPVAGNGDARRVSFLPLVQVVEVPCIPNDCHLDCFYRFADYHEFKQNLRTLFQGECRQCNEVTLIPSTMAEDYAESQSLSRGDEALAPDSSWLLLQEDSCRKQQQRLELRQEGLQAVMVEQHLQRLEGMDDPELLADLYYEASNKAMWEALHRGYLHAKEVAEDRLLQEKASGWPLGSKSRSSVERLLRRFPLEKHHWSAQSAACSESATAAGPAHEGKASWRPLRLGILLLQWMHDMLLDRDVGSEPEHADEAHLHSD